MAVGVSLEFPGITREQYEQLSQDMELSGPPQGELIHVRGPTPDEGWRTVEVWESREAFEAFADELLIAHGHLASPSPPKKSFSSPFTCWPSGSPLCLRFSP
ncbi:MAG: hypothetical protein M3305_06760 [Actinomycetota bacterium]|nr:hypothetical protein [Actinomycetota bacterium]